MTDNQLILLMICSGMMEEGLSSEEAIALILLMEEPAEDVSWLIERVGKTKVFNAKTKEKV
jgi:hypothetical protein